MKHLWMCAAVMALSAAACTPGKNGTNGNSCTVTSNADGSATIACTDGTTSTIEPGSIGVTGAEGATGATGTAGVSCTVSNGNNGSATITCPGASATVSDGQGPCGTLDGDLNISSALDIAAFQAAGCTTIDGNLTITADNGTLASVVSDLSGFSNLHSITGNLVIEGAYEGASDDQEDLLQATSLHGFQNLQTVGGTLYVDGTDWLTDANFASLTTVTGQFRIGEDDEGTGNFILASVEAPVLTSADGVYLDTMPQLATVDLSGLTSDGGKLEINDTALTGLSLSTLTSTGSDIHVLRDNSLTSIDLSGLTTAGGTLRIEGDGSLTTLTLTGLTSVTDDVTIDNDAITDLDLSALTTASGSLDIDESSDLASIELPSLATVSGTLYLSENDSLTSITLPGTAVTVGDGASISSDPKLCTPPVSSDFTFTTGSLDTSDDSTDDSCGG